MSFRSEFEQARDFLILHRADYNFAFQNFKWPKLEQFNWALDYFDSMAEGNTNVALWLVDEKGQEEKYSFADISQRSSQVANYLRKLGVHKGDHILLMLGNDVAHWETVLAAIKIGAVLVPASPLLSTEELGDRLNRGEIKGLITSHHEALRFDINTSAIVKIVTDGAVPGWHDYAEAAQESKNFVPEVPTQSQDPLFLFFSSGSTPKPELVHHTHFSYPVGNLSTMYWMGLRPGDVHMSIASPGWAAHLWSHLFAPWNAEATVFVYKQAHFEISHLLESLEKYRVTSFCAPPTVWRMLTQDTLTGYKMALRELTTEGAPLEIEVFEKIEQAWGVPLREGYCLTESTAFIGNSPGQEIKENSLGRPLPGYQVKLIEPGGQTGLDGEIFFRAVSSENEFLRTHDRGVVDEDGYIYFAGRGDEVFKSSDYRISPSELEFALQDHPAIREVAVIPSPDRLRLNVPKAVIFLAKGFEPTKDLALSIMTHSRNKLASFKRIRRIEFTDLPKSVSGEIQRLELQLREIKKVNSEEKSPYEFWEEDYRVSIPEIWAQDLP